MRYSKTKFTPFIITQHDATSQGLSSRMVTGSTNPADSSIERFSKQLRTLMSQLKSKRLDVEYIGNLRSHYVVIFLSSQDYVV